MGAKAREIDLPTVRERLTRGEPLRAIARNLDVKESTLRFHLKKGTPDIKVGIVDIIPKERNVSPEGGHGGDTSTPPLYPMKAGLQPYEGTPQASLSPQLAEALTMAWPALQQLLLWWHERQQQDDEPPEKLERATFHVAPRWIAAVRREADRTGESYAAVVNRAFRQYFIGREP